MSEVKLFDSLFELVSKVAERTDKVDGSLLEAIKVLSEGTMKNDNLLLDLINALIDRVKKLENTEKARYELLETLANELMEERQRVAMLEQSSLALQLQVNALFAKGTVN